MKCARPTGLAGGKDACHIIARCTAARKIERSLGVAATFRGRDETPHREGNAKVLRALQTENTSSSPNEMERREEERLREDEGDIYGIPRSEWVKLETPARYLGNEFGSIHKPWDEATVRFTLTYPEIYEVGASNLGHVILYGLLNKEPGLLCDRAYFPGSDLKALLEQHEKKLFGVESRRPLDEFDVLGFSLSYELGGTNILEMLAMSNVPLTWEERKEETGKPFDPASGSYPLIFAGGPTATSNPEPFSKFFDFFALGDGEELLVEIGECLKKCKNDRLDREETLYRLSTEVVGVYVPQFYDAPPGFGGAVYPIRDGVPARVQRRVCAPDPFQQIGLVPFVDTVHNRLTVEIRRGCTRGCRFCQPGMLTRPARDVDPDRVVDAVEHGMRLTGYNEFSLLSLSCSDYLSLPSVGIQIKNRFREENVSLSLPSQRVDRFDDNIANIVSNSGKKSGLTFAPEAGTQRMRDVINKGLTNEELLRGVKTAWDKGWKQVKLYFMIGLPGETDEDVMGIYETIKWLQQECRQGKWHLAVNVTISNFSPKPHTPFQWHSVSTSEFLRKQNLLRSALKRLYQVKANFTPVRISAMEDFISRGDRRIGDVIKRAWELGATNDGWWQSEDENFAAWSQAISEVGMEWKYRQVGAGEWDVMENVGDARFRGQGQGGKGRIDRGALEDQRLNAPLPWDHIDTGVTKWWLKTDLQKALEAITVPDCSHSGLCSECGVCGDEFGDNEVIEPPEIPEFAGFVKPNADKSQRIHFRFSKKGDAVFVGHLDMMKTWGRIVRRASLPISMDESPFAVRQRIYTALPLPLGATSDDEVLELWLTKRSDNLDEVRMKIEQQLPRGIEIKSVTEAEVKKADGSNGEKMSQLLSSVEYYISLDDDASLSDSEREQSLQLAINGLLSLDSLIVERKHKKKKGKVVKTDVRQGLEALEVIGSDDGPSRAICDSLPVRLHTTVVKFRCNCLNGNPSVAPDTLASALSTLSSGSRFSVQHIHRSQIHFREPSRSKPNMDRIRSLVRQEGHLAAAKIFQRSGPWSQGLENRFDVP